MAARLRAGTYGAAIHHRSATTGIGLLVRAFWSGPAGNTRRQVPSGAAVRCLTAAIDAVLIVDAANRVAEVAKVASAINAMRTSV